MTLLKLLSSNTNSETIEVRLYDENNLLLIVFNLPGYKCLDDELEVREVVKWNIISAKQIEVFVRAGSDDPDPVEDLDEIDDEL